MDMNLSRRNGPKGGGFKIRLIFSNSFIGCKDFIVFINQTSAIARAAIQDLPPNLVDGTSICPKIRCPSI
jgi:hypothetical protein